MVKIKLLNDLTRYDQRLIIGEIGTIINKLPNRGDRFATIRFNNGACLDVLWENLEILDKEYLQKLDEKLEALKNAKNVKITKGPRGGFKYISYEYILNGTRNNISDGNLHSANKLIEIFKKNGIQIDEEILR